MWSSDLAVLLVLGAALDDLVVVEFAFDLLAGAVKEIDGRPQEIVEVGFEARVFHAGNQCIEDVRDGTCNTVAFGQWSGIGFILEGSVAVELKLLQNVVGRGRGVVRFKVVMVVHRMLHRLDRALAAFMAMKPTDALALHSESRSDSGGWQRPAILLRDGKARQGRAAGK